MSLYYLQKFLYVLNRDDLAQKKYQDDLESLLGEYDLTEEEAGRAKRMRRRLVRFLSEARSEGWNVTGREASVEERRELSALGYSDRVKGD